MNASHRTIVALNVLCIGMFAAAAAWAAPTIMPLRVADALRADNLQGCLAWWYPRQHVESCFTTEMGRMLDQDGPSAVKTFDRLAERDPVFGARCHSRMHTVSRAYASRTGIDAGNVSRYLLASDNVNCAAGYTHGLMLGVISASPGASDTRALLDMCVREPTRLRRKNCIHGFGHAFMRANGSYLDQSIDACRGLGPSGDADCAAGAFHEFTFALGGVDDAAPLPADVSSPLEMCSLVPDLSVNMLRACYVRSIPVPTLGPEPLESVADVVRYCAGSVPERHRGPCVTGGAWSLGAADPETRVAQCVRDGGDYGVDCVMSIGSAHGLTPGGVEDRLRGCMSFDTGAERLACAEWFGHEMSISRNEPLATCGGVDDADVRAGCTRGAARIDEPLGVY